MRTPHEILGRNVRVHRILYVSARQFYGVLGPVYLAFGQNIGHRLLHFRGRSGLALDHKLFQLVLDMPRFHIRHTLRLHIQGFWQRLRSSVDAALDIVPSLNLIHLQLPEPLLVLNLFVPDLNLVVHLLVRSIELPAKGVLAKELLQRA